MREISRETSFVRDRIDPWLIWRRPDVDAERIVHALSASGEVLKRSKKSVTRLVNDWVVKETGGGLISCLKLNLFRSRYRRAWRAAVYLAARGVRVPSPIAFAEQRRAGIIAANALVSDFLADHVNVEQFAANLREKEAPGEAIDAYLNRIAEAVNALCAAGAYHSDLSGKNIFTRDGASFCFIDLDGVRLNTAYTPRRRLKNHVQLYDSFCDLWEDETLKPFISAMCAEGQSVDEWFVRVRAGQARRRARIEAIWRKRGNRRDA